ncbi:MULTISPECIES: DNA-formamidopyrimidine glycosylase family protein [unclassified Cellulomonas]|uniref:Fpg/Nei family DNA glycosylase n=1 Tax=unclassified Cellulomonas TaxID=2620175 RepID=UPI0019991109|nr:DNA-formamidopyrimidine glycosylase family protein [Cellulomonas sp. ES6]MBD3778217.1 Fpg/Nei family DNA glycosylase [Micrococcales bacterium]WHP17473.1 DNA-formamidopyrimidine glycosylase family protein [Cellulomonas sp. ES6]
MPELPEVESLAAFLRERAVGRTVAGVEVGAISALKTFRPAPQDLAGGEVVSAGRHGKWLDLGVRPPAGGDALHLVFHLARAGWLRWSEPLPATPVRPGRSPLALRVRLDDGSGFDLTEAGTRKRLAVYVVTDPADVPQVATLGVEPLSPEFTPQRLAELMAARNQQVKGLLRDQGTIAGIGNAYSDEILLVARTSPFALTRSFDAERVARLHAATVGVLREAVATSAGRPAAELKDAKRRGMRVHGRTGLPCPGWDGVPCGDTVHEVSFADSSLQYCPTCQTGGTPLADRRMSRLLR